MDKLLKRHKFLFVLASFVFLILLLSIGYAILSITKAYSNTSEYVFKNPNAEEILSSDSDADIFQFDGVIYKKDSDIVKERHLQKRNRSEK